MFRFVASLSLLGALTCVLTCAAPSARADKLDPDNPPRTATARETELGEKAAQEVAKARSLPLLDAQKSPENARLIERVGTMARRLGAVSKRPGLSYDVKVIDKKEINAFTLPGGNIYLFRGLIDAVASDDELAAVLAHEIAHNTRLHALRGQQKASKWNWASLAAVAAILAAGRDGANIAQFASYALTAVMNGYTLDFEKEADAEAMELLTKAGYNPSAMVTFMQRLQHEQERRPEVKLGIFQTHPAPDERVEAALAELDKRKLPFNPRAATDAGSVKVVEKGAVYQLQLREIVVIELAKDAPDARSRADEIAARTSQALLGGLKAHEMSVRNGQLFGRGVLLATATLADARLAQKSSDDLAREWMSNFNRLFLREQLNGRF